MQNEVVRQGPLSAQELIDFLLQYNFPPSNIDLVVHRITSFYPPEQRFRVSLHVDSGALTIEAVP